MGYKHNGATLARSRVARSSCRVNHFYIKILFLKD